MIFLNYRLKHKNIDKMINEMALISWQAPLKQPRFSTFIANLILSGKRHSLSSWHRNAGTAAVDTPSIEMNSGGHWLIKKWPSHAFERLISTVWLSICWQFTSDAWFVPFCLLNEFLKLNFENYGTINFIPW